LYKAHNEVRRCSCV